MPVWAAEQGGPPPLVNEYFVRQGMGELLFIRVNSYEAQSNARVLDRDGVVLLSSSLPGTRVAPLFLYVDDAPEERQIDIEVSSPSHTNRTRIELGVSRLVVRDERTSRLAQAYQYLAYGMETLEEDSAPNWTVKINAMMAAAEVFEAFGMEELRLWSRFYAAHFVHHKLNDANAALGLLEETLGQISSGRHRDIALALLRLRGDIVVSMREAAMLPPRASGADPVQTALEDLARAAGVLGQQFERARAEYLRGADLAARSAWSGALSQLDLALDIAVAIEAGELVTQIREDMVRIHDEQGNLSASSEVLQDIESQLTDEGSGEELALNRLQQGRLLISTFRYAEAITVLQQALQAERNSMTRAQVALELGRAHYQTGQVDLAMANLEQAVINPGSGQLRRPNPLLDTGEGLRIIANVHRQRGNYADMRRLREAAVDYLVSDPARAAHYYELGMDGVARGALQNASSAFASSARAGQAGGQPRWGQLAALQACALGLDSCQSGAAQRAYDSLLSAGLPAQAVQARWLRARHLARAGRRTDAFRELDNLVGEIYFLRRSLPGVLGAWLFENIEPVFETYLAQAVSVSDKASLLAFSKTRFAARGLPSMTDLPALAADTRVLVARRVESVDQGEQASLAGRIDNTLAAGRVSFLEDRPFLGQVGLDDYLASLQSSEAVLAFDVGVDAAQVWVATRSGVTRVSLPRGAEVYRAVMDARADLEILDGRAFDEAADRLGSLLLGPVISRLPETVYWLPAGLLLGLPLDALRVNGRYLAEDHQVAAVMNFPAQPAPASRRQLAAMDRVFLAGNPVDFSNTYLQQLDTTDELRTVTDAFVGPGLTIVQGNALLPDEFSDERLANAQVVHLAMPAGIDLQHAQRSWFEMSEPRRGAGRQRVLAVDMRTGSLDAGLVFISQASVSGAPEFRFSSRTGLVDEMLDAGAGAVISTTWPAGTMETAWLVQDFYANLRANPDPMAALSATKRRFMASFEGRGTRAWAAFQLMLH
jgi:tetratricopeptide (TPR) repeat protein